ncbi:hypothetical protein Pmar_PMAR026503 [Perkinsus marinus ATCC 50983]|uniref:Uncharacterized protein n=1 Tax=Perkinsus marinus (strain ATCC 50983 / TXsc) TaxID=423536 RepID=C5LDQ5_PERM5|nr:hypothetical protein Pmar_PMAR026503 [Perkinsus marinus ATCC 50983]EER05069.1 hypothetical protein Pmar_PMAR026503 [Perkinsus marinus ATCC 50983]|eukprot:XP_002773253.1 hypothetical protein Pmar_PMAR026503 [Perkinsus marinus ATCC 50983]
MPKIVDLLGSSSVESATVTPRETEVRTVPERLAWQTEKDFWGSPSSGGNASEHTEGGSVDSVVENRRTSSGESGSNSGNRGRHLLSFAISNDSSVPVVEPAENLPVVEALKTVHPQRVRAISVGAGGNSPVEKTAFGRARRASEGTYDVGAGQRSLRWCLHDDYAEEEEKQYGDVGEREPIESIETAVRRAVASVEEIPLLSTTVEVVPLGGVLASTAEKLSSSSVGLTTVYHVEESDGMTGCSNSRVMSPDPVAEEGSSISDTSAPRRILILLRIEQILMGLQMLRAAVMRRRVRTMFWNR